MGEGLAFSRIKMLFDKAGVDAECTFIEEWQWDNKAMS